MKMFVYMMAEATGKLADRLETLTGQEATSCLQRLTELETRMNEEIDLERVLPRFRALADPKRLKVASMLARTDELCACEIQASLGVTHATVSHHMDLLREAGLVEANKSGRWVYYRLADDAGRWVP